MRYSLGKHISQNHRFVPFWWPILFKEPLNLSSPSIMVQRGSCCGNLLITAFSPDLWPLSGVSSLR